MGDARRTAKDDQTTAASQDDWVADVDIDALAKMLLELIKQELRRERERR